MTKKKYKTFSDPMPENPVYQCSKKKCKWQGKSNEKIELPHPEYSEGTTLCCPKCHNNEFYILLPCQ